MKPMTPEMLEAHHNATVRGMTEGFVASGLLAGAGFWGLNRKWANFRTLPTTLKTLLAVCVILPVMTLQGERRGTEYDMTNWEGEIGMSLVSKEDHDLDARWDEMSLSSKIGNWAQRHEWTLILSSWAGSLGIASAIISRNKFQTFPQKIVQARMWAQGLTVGILIAAGALQGVKRRTAVEQVDHSWKTILSEQKDRDDKLRIGQASI